MNRISIKDIFLVLVVCLSVLLSIQTRESNASPAYLYTNQEIDNLLAPIALYPDPLLAQILPASTYPAEITDADAWLNSGGSISSIDGQNWDESVTAIAYYPDILKMMAENIDWTADLGDAFLNQPEEVTRSIQRLRWQARETGNLESTSQQTVVIVENNIEIIPAQPQYIYVPQYDSSVIYMQRWAPGRSPFISFGLGLAMGGWLTMDFDWGRHSVIYHGWNRPGWVNHAKPHVLISNVNVNRSRPYISQKWRHEPSRGNPERYRASRPGSGASVGRNSHMPETRGGTLRPPKPFQRVFGPVGNIPSFSNRGKESRGIISAPSPPLPQEHGKRPAMPIPAVGKVPPLVRPIHETTQHPQTPSATFGGYRGEKEARGQSLRGQTSRQSSPAVHPPALPITKRSAPERTGGAKAVAPGGKDDTRGRQRR
jgi:hypothetical protein